MSTRADWTHGRWGGYRMWGWLHSAGRVRFFARRERGGWDMARDPHGSCAGSHVEQDVCTWLHERWRAHAAVHGQRDVVRRHCSLYSYVGVRAYEGCRLGLQLTVGPGGALMWYIVNCPASTINGISFPEVPGGTSATGTCTAGLTLFNATVAKRSCGVGGIWASSTIGVCVSTWAG